MAGFLLLAFIQSGSAALTSAPEEEISLSEPSLTASLEVDSYMLEIVARSTGPGFSNITLVKHGQEVFQMSLGEVVGVQRLEHFGLTLPAVIEITEKGKGTGLVMHVIHWYVIEEDRLREVLSLTTFESFYGPITRDKGGRRYLRRQVFIRGDERATGWPDVEVETYRATFLQVREGGDLTMSRQRRWSSRWRYDPEAKRYRRE